MVRPLLIAVLLGIASGAARAQACRDIRQFDFRNAAIPVAARDEAGDDSGPDSFSLHYGKGFESDGLPGAHDWSLELLSDQLEHPDPSTWIRVIVVDMDHVTGSGDWRYVMAFTCKNGSLDSVFPYGAPGVALERLTERTMKLYVAVETESDPECCPSGHKDIAYRSNAQRHRYRKVSSITGPGFNPSKMN